MDWEKFRAVPSNPLPSGGISPPESWKMLCHLFLPLSSTGGTLWPFGKVLPFVLDRPSRTTQARRISESLFHMQAFKYLRTRHSCLPLILHFFFFNTTPLVSSPVLSHGFYFLYHPGCSPMDVLPILASLCNILSLYSVLVRLQLNNKN